MRLSVAFSILVAVLAVVIPASAQEDSPTLGIGFNLGLQKPYCDVLHTGFTPAGEANLRFLLGKYYNLGIGLGYGQLSDGFSKRTFTTNVFNADLKGNLYLTSGGPLRPFATAGVGYINFTYKREKPWAIGDPRNEKKPFSDVGYFVGGGLDYHLNDKTALTASLDYRFTNTDLLDGFDSFGKYKDGWLNGRVGLVFFSGRKKEQPREELIVERAPVSQTDQTEPPLDEETAEILRSLGVYTEPTEPARQPLTPDATTTPSTTETAPYTTETAPASYDLEQLQRRVDELRALINKRESDIAALQEQIRLHDARIAELQRELSQARSTPGDFSTTYQNGLRYFSTRNYDQAISTFTSLRTAYPDHKLASNCIYWVGESYFAKGNFSAAAEAFLQVLNYPQSYKLDDATLMLGRCYQRMGQLDKAKTYFQRLLDQFPDSEYVPKARAWLQRLP